MLYLSQRFASAIPRTLEVIHSLFVKAFDTVLRLGGHRLNKAIKLLTYSQLTKTFKVQTLLTPNGWNRRAQTYDALLSLL